MRGSLPSPNAEVIVSGRALESLSNFVFCEKIFTLSPAGYSRPIASRHLVEMFAPCYPAHNDKKRPPRWERPFWGSWATRGAKSTGKNSPRLLSPRSTQAPLHAMDHIAIVIIQTCESEELGRSLAGIRAPLQRCRMPLSFATPSWGRLTRRARTRPGDLRHTWGD